MKIKIYTTTNCPYCRMAKEYFQKKGIEFEEIDVSIDGDSASQMIEISGQMGVPVIKINGKIIIGFNKPKIEMLINTKHERKNSMLKDI